MDTWLPIIKAWKQKDIKKTHKLLKKIESSLTIDTFKVFFYPKSLHICKLEHHTQMACNIDSNKTG